MNRIFDFLKYLKSVDGATMLLARRMHKILINVISSLFALLILGYFLNICGLKGVNILFGLILVIGALCAITKPDLLLRLVELGALGGILSPNQTVEQSIKTLTTGYLQTVKVILFFWSFGFFTLGVISFTSSPSLFWVLLLGVVVLALWPSTTKESKVTYAMSPVRKGIVCVMAITVIFLLAQQWGFLSEGSPKDKISSAVNSVSSVVGDVFAGEPESRLTVFRTVYYNPGESGIDGMTVGDLGTEPYEVRCVKDDNMYSQLWSDGHRENISCNGIHNHDMEHVSKMPNPDKRTYGRIIISKGTGFTKLNINVPRMQEEYQDITGSLKIEFLR